MVLLDGVSVAGSFIPIACHDGATGQSAYGERCLNLVPSGAELPFQGLRLRITGRTIHDCRGTKTPALHAEWNVDPASIGKHSMLGMAAWPESEASRFTPLEVPDAVDGDADHPPQLTAPQRAALDAAAHRYAPTSSGAFEPFYSRSVDIDGDGRKERFISMRSRAGSGELFILWGDAPEVPVLVEARAERELYPYAALSLTPDGRRELLYHEVRTGLDHLEGDFVNVRFDGREPREAARWRTCG
jgi:hypothetical protein